MSDDGRSNGSDSELLLSTRGRHDAAVQTSDSSTSSLQADGSEVTTPRTVSEPSPVATPERHGELWFDDGDLVIIAGNVEFRVYREPIARHSSILSDMMSAQESIRTESDIAAPGPPYAELHLSDSPEDVKYFLQGFVAGKTLCGVGEYDSTYHEVSAQIRLGHRYGVDSMVSMRLAYLELYFPPLAAEDWIYTDCRKPPKFDDIHAIGVVNLARLTGTDELLPAALMACSCLGQKVVNGFTRADGTQETLSMDDLARCIAGRAALSRAYIAATRALFRPEVAAGCTRPSQCKTVFDRLILNLAENESALHGVTFQETNPWTATVEKCDVDRLLCPKCYAMIGSYGSSRQTEQIAKLLSELPDIMGVAKVKADAASEEGEDTKEEETTSESQSKGTIYRDVAIQAEPCPHDDELWFEHGNLTLITSDVEFRVWKGPLVFHSPVFRDMLSLPQSPSDAQSPPCPGPTSTSHAVVHVSDSSHDLRQFLRAFFTGDAFSGLEFPSPTYEQVSAQIRLGHKYEVDGLVQPNLDYLRYYYPDTFEGWWKEPRGGPPDFKPHHVIGIVNLARLTGASTILRVALMKCALLDVDMIMNGFVRKDGERETLSLQDIGRCLSGKNADVQATASAQHKVFAPQVANNCTRSKRCRPMLQKMLDGVMQHDEQLAKFRWWESWQGYVDKVDEHRELCWNCYRMVCFKRKKDAERAIFAKLPEMLELDEPPKAP